MQIDYRVWDKENKKMINVLAKDYYGPDLMYTGYLDSEKARLLEWDNSNEIKVILMPYIGKKDKCGTKAYEKDIIEYKAFDLLNKEILFRGFIYYCKQNCAFRVNFPDINQTMGFSEIGSNFIIIGNILDDPKLVNITRSI